MKKTLSCLLCLMFLLSSCAVKEDLVEENQTEISAALEVKIDYLNAKVEILEEEILELEKTRESDALEQIKKILDLHKRIDELSEEVYSEKKVNSEFKESTNTRILELEVLVDNFRVKLEELSQHNEFYASNLIKVHDFYDEQLTHSQIIDNVLEFSNSMEERVLLFDSLDWKIDKAIQLPSNTTVLIDGVTIKQNDLVFDNVFRGDNLILNPDDPNGFPLKINTLENIKILGLNDAKVIGCDVNTSIYNDYLGVFEEAVGDYYGWRTLQISLTNCVGIEISGISFSQTRCWCISLDMCKDIEIHDLEINSNVKNGDGVDIRKGCSNFKIYNITGDTSDDLVAVTSLTSNLSFSSRASMYPMEPSGMLMNVIDGLEGGIFNGTIRNIKKAGGYHAVIVLASRGRKVNNIYIDNVEEVKSRTRDALVRVYTGYGSGYSAGDLSSIKINNIRGIGKYTKAVVYFNTTVFDSWINKVSSVNGNSVLLDDPSGVVVTNSN